jgi:4-hydroxybenzoate polyprenyltransferase
MERLSNEMVGPDGRPQGAPGTPLFVDLDGTLVRTDLLFETLMSALKRRPWILLALPFWLARGRAYLKRRLAECGPVRVDLLPYDSDVVTLLAGERERGRTLVLATAADATLARGVAAHLGLFDGVIASDGVRNLKSDAKLSAIRDWATGPFDYMGNGSEDVAIWMVAQRAIAVRCDDGALRRIAARGTPIQRVGTRPAALATLLRALRPHQWAKNALIFLPLLASHIYTDISLFVRDSITFVAFSLCASSVYVINDLLDLDADRAHPRKRRRPFAAGELPIPVGLAASVVLLAGSAALAWFVGPSVLAVLGIYFALTLSYSLKLKAIVLVDTIVLAGLYTIRVIAGYAATDLIPSFYLLAFALFLFFGLAMLKRFSELVDVRKRSVVSPPGRGYRAEDQEVVGVFGAVTSGLAILVLAFYINTDGVAQLYGHPQRLWGIVPVLLYWVSKVWLIAHRGEMHEDPVVYALTDRESLCVFLLCVAIATFATF